MSRVVSNRSQQSRPFAERTRNSTSLSAQDSSGSGWIPRLAPAVFLLVILGFQVLEGAYSSEYGAQPDEAAHFVTGLMVRDYIAAGLPGNPLAFATAFYEHYPKVAIGHWPPLFYLTQAAWTLPFGSSRTSILIFMAVQTAALAWTIFLLTRHTLGLRWAWFAGLLLLFLPQIHQYGGMLMMEIPISLLSLCAAIAYARYLETGRWQASLAFGLIATAAIMTKYTGAALAVLPVFGVVLCARWTWLKRFSFWLPAATVVTVCVPWLVLTWDMASDGFAEEQLSLEFVTRAAPYFAASIVSETGVVLLVLAAAGVIAAWRTPAHKPLAVSLIGVIAGTYVLHAVVPAGIEPRYMVAVLPPLVFFAVMGLRAVSEILARNAMPVRTAFFLPIALCAAGFAFETFELRPKGYGGFEPVAVRLKVEAPEAGTIVLVSSDAAGEGTLIAEIAMDEKRPDTIVKRASQTVATSRWAGRDYELNVAGMEETIRLLAAEGIEFLVIDRSIPTHLRTPHHELLENAAKSAAGRWTLVNKFPVTRSGATTREGLELYRLR